MSPIGASFALGAPPMTMPGGRPPGTSAKVGARPLTTPWPTTFDAVSVPWPSIAGSKSPVQARSAPGASRTTMPRLVGPPGRTDPVGPVPSEM